MVGHLLNNRDQLAWSDFGMVAVAGVSALLFSGFILYDTSRLIRGEEDNYIMTAMSMYLNILNLFLDLLRLIAAFRD